jgi:hypothetical protein
VSTCPVELPQVRSKEVAAPAPVPAARDTNLLRLVLWIALYALPINTALHPISEYDTFWHLRTGQWIVENGTIPATDPFSSFGMDKPWVAYSWLFGLLLYGLYEAFGLIGIIGYRVVLAVAVVAALHRLVARRQTSFAFAAGLVAAAAVALTPLLLGERPGLLTILFATLTLDAILLLREGSRSRLVWLLPICYILWANIHIQFVHGLFLLGLACAAPLADRLLGLGTAGENADRWGSRGWWKLVALTAACFLATLINPYHLRIYSVVLEYSRQTETYHLFPELKAMDFRQISDWVVLGLTGAAAFTLGRRGRGSAFEVLLLLATAYFSFHAKHDLWFVVLASVGIVATARRRSVSVDHVEALTWPQRLVGIAVLVLITLFTCWRRDLTNARLETELAAEFPVAAARVIEERGCKGPLYNHFDWGGYLIWRLPQLPAAIDGRTNIHGDKRIQRFADTWAAAPGWDEDPELQAARLVVLQVRAPLTSLLRLDPRWTVVHEDPVAVVFAKSDH